MPGDTTRRGAGTARHRERPQIVICNALASSAPLFTTARTTRAFLFSERSKMKLFAIKLSIIGADGTPEVVVTAMYSTSAMDAAIQALGQYPALVSLSVKPVKE